MTGSFTIAQPPSSESTGVGTAGNALTIKDGLNAVTRVFRQIDLSPTWPAATAGLVFNAPTILGSTQPQLGKPGTTIGLGFLSRGHAGSGFSSGSHLFEGVGTGKDSCNNSWTHDFTENDKPHARPSCKRRRRPWFVQEPFARAHQGSWPVSSAGDDGARPCIADGGRKRFSVLRVSLRASVAATP